MSDTPHPDHAIGPERAFGEALVGLMGTRGLDYRTLGRLVGVSHAHLWQLVRASRDAVRTGTLPARRPTKDLLHRLCEVLEVTDEVLGGYPEEPGDSRNRQLPPVLAHAPLRPEAPGRFEAGLASLRLGQPERAILLLRQATQDGEVTLALAEAGLGVAYLKAGRPVEAERAFTAALDHLEDRDEVSPKRADILYDRGLARQDQGRHAAACADFKAAIATGLDQPERALAGLCFSGLALGRWRAVTRDVLAWTGRPEAERIHSTSSLDLRAYGAYAMCRLGQHAAALAMLDSVVLLCPTYWYGLYVRAAVRARAATRARPSGAAARRLVEGCLADAARTLRLNPEARNILLRDDDADFTNVAALPAWQAMLGQAEVSDR
ncbi:MAG: helix-turn-helix transcriptional regulator [Candidatus Sericytochromatia bacterium]|nr:helix-turn-helix transcriptional regulator [Candidatus Sericytochromatia bacterium]